MVRGNVIVSITVALADKEVVGMLEAGGRGSLGKLSWKSTSEHFLERFSWKYFLAVLSEVRSGHVSRETILGKYLGELS